MPTQFELPNLSQKDYQKLFAELRAGIPQYSGNWTDFNDSDPGITLLQLLSWLGDVSLYRIDALPQELYLNFARLVIGSGYDALEELESELSNQCVLDTQGRQVFIGDNPVIMDPDRLVLATYLCRIQYNEKINVQELRAACLSYWKASYRAITEDDFETIAKQVTALVDPEDYPAVKIARAKAMFSSDSVQLVLVPLSRPTLKSTITTSTSGRSLCTLEATLNAGEILVNFTEFEDVIYAASKFFEPRILLGTALNIFAANQEPIRIVGELAVEKNADPKTVLNLALDALSAWLDPITGGVDGTGWPIGRSVTDYDLAKPISTVAGIDHSQPIHLSVTDFPSFIVGKSVLNRTASLGGNPEISLPMLADVSLTAVPDTWPIQVGVHSRVGADTSLPWSGA